MLSLVIISVVVALKRRRRKLFVCFCFVYKQEPTVSGVEDALEDEMQERVAIDEENPQAEEDNQTDAVFPQTSSQEANPQSEPGKTTAVSSTPTFTFRYGFVLVIYHSELL